MIHHGFRQGKRVIVMMRDGCKIIGKFDKNYSKGLIVDGQRLPYIDMRSATIYKNNPR